LWITRSAAPTASNTISPYLGVSGAYLPVSQENIGHFRLDLCRKVR
jgi:hypothetical protein